MKYIGKEFLYFNQANALSLDDACVWAYQILEPLLKLSFPNTGN